MSSSSDEENAILAWYLLRRKRKTRRMWVHPYIERNFHSRLFVGAKELQYSDAKFLEFYRMTKESYSTLLELVAPALQYVNTPMRDCINAEERILITLRYLATGCTFASLALYFCRGATTVCQIVSETTKIIWNELNDTYMPCPNRDKWEHIAQRFQFLWNLPNCIGAIGEKHIRVEKPPNTDLTNFNHKSYHSIVLLGCCDADGMFTMVETGYAKRNSDGGIFKASAIKQLLTNSQLDIPPPSMLPLDEYDDCLFPYYFVGDEAFPLSRYLLRPYSKRVLDNTRRIFNYRLSRGRKSIEHTFGAMTEKFQVLSSMIRCRDANKVNDIIKCVCLLHNYIKKKEGCQYTVHKTEENVNITGSANHPSFSTQPRAKVNNLSTANAFRNYLANYFLTPTASLPWQWSYCT